MLRPVFVLLALTGCDLTPNRGNAPIVPPEQLYLSIADQTLAPGVVGEPYDSAIRVSGGDPKYVFTQIDDLPGGLSLTSEGHVRGEPTQAGAFTFSVVAQDTKGRSKRALVSITIGLDPLLVACGDTIEGTFTTDAIGVDGRPDLDASGGVAWIAVELPEELTTRVELRFQNENNSTLWVEQPNEPIGSWELDDLYSPRTIEGGGVESVSTVDAGTDPSLTGFATQSLLPMVLVASGSGDWKLSVECSDGPVFTTLLQYPIEQGTGFAYDFDVYGADNNDIRIWTNDPLPDWMVWDEATGLVTSTTGLAETDGAWELTIHAETPDGRKRTERAIIGVYDVVDVPCGSSAPVEVTESYFDGEFYAYYDTKGFDVYRVDLASAAPSIVTLQATGSDAHYLGLAEPNPEWLNFYGGAERVYIDGDTALRVDPKTYPATRHFADATELYFSAGSIGSDFAGIEVTVECDFTPLPDLSAMPVLEVLEAVDVQLDAIGGEPPYAWGASGLPAGLQMQRDGRITGNTSLAGTFDVTLTVTDKNGLTGSADYPLQVGAEDACLGHKRVYCGESFSNEFIRAYYSDSGSKDSTRTFCIIDDSDRNIGIELYSEDGQYRVDIADPGIDDKDDVVDPLRSTYVAFVDKNAVEGVSLDPFSWPDIDDYQNLPIFITLRAYDPGEWTAHFVCTP
jgi:hypothetical protein